jgi:hypothetical protein
MNNIKVVVSKDYRDTKSKEEHISDYIESLVSVRALRLLKDDIDIPALMDMYLALRGKHAPPEEADE